MIFIMARWQKCNAIIIYFSACFACIHLNSPFSQQIIDDSKQNLEAKDILTILVFMPFYCSRLRIQKKITTVYKNNVIRNCKYLTDWNTKWLSFAHQPIFAHKNTATQYYLFHSIHPSAFFRFNTKKAQAAKLWYKIFCCLTFPSWIIRNLHMIILCTYILWKNLLSNIYELGRIAYHTQQSTTSKITKKFIYTCNIYLSSSSLSFLFQYFFPCYIHTFTIFQTIHEHAKCQYNTGNKTRTKHSFQVENFLRKIQILLKTIKSKFYSNSAWGNLPSLTILSVMHYEEQYHHAQNMPGCC